jgi:ABC-2 type transport system permease protein
MGKIKLIIKREYLTRVRKRSFILMTLLGPLLMAALIIVPIYFASMQGDTKVIGILDESGLFSGKFEATDNLQFIELSGSVEEAKQIVINESLYALVHIPATSLSVPETAKIYSTGQPNIIVKTYIRESMRKQVEELKLQASGIDPMVLKSIKTKINLLTIKINEGGDEQSSYTELGMGIGFVSGLVIYIFIFMYGTQVMRGVIEEKTNRIIEVIVSSVKPFQLMMGKIVGVAMVGLTQFVLWVLLTLIIVSTFLSFYSDEISSYQKSQMNIQEQVSASGLTPDTNVADLNPAVDGSTVNDSLFIIIDMLNSINFELIIGMFLFYFIGGYLLYGALFAAIGSAVDSETDTQQFILPLTVPLILSIAVAQFIMMNPEGPAAFWMSILPLTSPVVMMVRLPFGVPAEELALSVALLIGGFFFTTWLAAKVYRTGILMYGKKINYKELWKWVRYKH